MLAYAVAIFLGSFLVFLVQPLIGKYILPWYGGSPAVWTTCLLFFQLMLVAGYAYAHALATWLRPRQQVVVHLSVLALSWLCLPIIPSVEWRQATVASPSLAIIMLLAATVGGPYLVLAASAPLLQKWFSLSISTQTPYRLYALSNIASLGALLLYPFLLERYLFLQSQCWLWTVLYGAYSLSLLVCAVALWRRLGQTSHLPEMASQAAAENAVVKRPAQRAFDFLLWILLAACGTLLLMAATNQLTQDIVPVPFLWILPLGLYLLSFIICFDRPEWYVRNVYTWLFVASMILIAGDFIYSWKSFALQVTLYSVNVFSGCMCCHGELVQRRPAASGLTTFYLAIAVGGALGGLAVAVGAPAIFSELREFWVGNVLVCLLLLVCRRAEKIHGMMERVGAAPVLGAIVASLALVVAAFALSTDLQMSDGETQVLAARRNFYGVLQIRDVSSPEPHQAHVSMSHGTTIHGFQFREPERAQTPTSYYERESGIGRTLAAYPRRAHGGLNIGVVGLGAGTLAAYAEKGDTMVYYEINPLVVELCHRYFTFIETAERRGAKVEVLVGDARLLLEQQLAEGKPQKFDILAVDAFSSDAIPVHLLTRECFDMYVQHLADDGVLAVHASNRHVNLEPVVAQQAARLQLPVLLVKRLAKDDTARNVEATPSDWIILTRNQAVLERLKATPHVAEAQTVAGMSEWTDNYSSLFEVLR